MGTSPSCSGDVSGFPHAEWGRGGVVPTSEGGGAEGVMCPHPAHGTWQAAQPRDRRHDTAAGRRALCPPRARASRGRRQPFVPPPAPCKGQQEQDSRVAPRHRLQRRTPQTQGAGTPKLTRASCTRYGDTSAPGDTCPGAAWLLLRGPGAGEGPVVLGGEQGVFAPLGEPSSLLTQRQPPPEESGAESAAG